MDRTQRHGAARISIGALLLAFSAHMEAASCDSASLALPGTTITRAESIAPQSGNAYCRINAVLKPTSDSAIGMELWLPANANWNGKFLGVGGGGLGGRFDYVAMASALARGYAVAANDAGHDNSLPLGAFVLGHPEKLIDFAYRATHVSAVAGKAISGQYYGRAPSRAYFSECSKGGTEAMMEAQRFPEDYDGIIAGAPAVNWTHHEVGSHLWAARVLFGSPGSAISAEKAALIGRAVLAACDSRDGVKDGLLQDPLECHFDPGRLQCKGKVAAACLTGDEVEAVRKLWRGPSRELGPDYYPGLERGGEPETWKGWIVSPTGPENYHALLGVPFFKYFVFADPKWEAGTIDWPRLAFVTDHVLAATMNASDPNLTAFRRRGGKLLHYHGFSDPDIPPRSSIRYYESVAKKMGGEHEIESFYRLFLLPGVGHCVGGPGPSSFDSLTALEQWVEHDAAPERLIASKHVNNDPTKPVLRARPLCPYPQRARYLGKGSIDEAESFTCQR